MTEHWAFVFMIDSPVVPRYNSCDDVTINGTTCIFRQVGRLDSGDFSPHAGTPGVGRCAELVVVGISAFRSKRSESRLSALSVGEP